MAFSDSPTKRASCAGCTSFQSISHARQSSSFAVRNPYANPRDKTGKRGVSSVCGLMSKVLNLGVRNQTIYRFRPVLFTSVVINAKGTHLLTTALIARRFEAGALTEPAGMRCTNEQVGKMRNRLEAEDALRFQCRRPFIRYRLPRRCGCGSMRR